MKKLLTFFTILFLMACSSKKNPAKSSNLNDNFHINTNSISIITPYIEIKEKSNLSFINHPNKRKSLTDFTIQVLQSEYPNSKYIEVPFLFKDYKTINSSLERKISSKVEIAPIELLTNKSENSIFISVNGYFGDINRGVMMLYIIDNKNRTWKMIERYVYNNSPLETEKAKRRILKSLEKLN